MKQRYYNHLLCVVIHENNKNSSMKHGYKAWIELTCHIIKKQKRIIDRQIGRQIGLPDEKVGGITFAFAKRFSLCSQNKKMKLHRC